MKRVQFSVIVAIVVVFVSLATPAQAQFTLTDIYDFNQPTNANPYDFGQLTIGADGNLYGTASGGASGYGSIFMTSPDGSTYNQWPFDGKNGALLSAALTPAQDGNFYGTTGGDGKYEHGTLFRFDPSTATIKVLHNFTNGADGENPFVPPVEPKVADGFLYGFSIGTNGSGIVPYRVNVAKGTFKAYPQQLTGCPIFCSTAPLVAASDGNFYGTTSVNPPGVTGSIFRMTTKGVITTVYSFTGGDDGENPIGPLALGSDGLLYGTASQGGLYGSGAIFNFDISSRKLTPLYSFSAVNSSGINNDGANPFAGLVAALDGNLYGTTDSGGSNGLGAAFRIATGGGSFQPLASFSGNFNDTTNDATFTEYTDGSFYAVDTYGGAYDWGYVYRLNSSSRNFNITLCCNRWLVLDQPVTVLGQNLEGAVSVTFGGAAAQFQSGSSTYLTAEVPSGAIDGPVVVTLATGQQVESLVVHIAPTITNLDPSSGPPGSQVNIVGGGFAGTTKVKFGGVKATSFTVITPSLIQAIVPAGAKTGKVALVTPNGNATSKQIFTVN